MSSRKVLGLGIPLIICIILVGSGIGVAAAYSVRSLSSFKLSVFEQTYQDSEFTAAVTKTIIGKSSVTIQIRVTNNGTSTHSASATVSCYDANGNLLQELSQLTGDVNASQHIDLTCIFNSVSRDDFGYSEIIIEDLT